MGGEEGVQKLRNNSPVAKIMKAKPSEAMRILILLVAERSLYFINKDKYWITKG